MNKLVLSASLAIVMSASAFATPQWEMEVKNDFVNLAKVRDRIEDLNNCQGQAYIKRIGAGMIYTDEIKIRCYPRETKQLPEPQFWSAYDIPLKDSLAAVFHNANLCSSIGGKATIKQGSGSTFGPSVFNVKCGSFK